MNLKIRHDSYKIGVDEIEGLKDAMKQAIAPVLAEIKDRIYWDDCLDSKFTEYKSRDGFIPYNHNCGGIEITLIVPNCEVSSFKYLEYVECDDCEAGDGNQCGYKGMECGAEGDGHLDSKLRVWLKFEGLTDGEMHFYLYCGGGNGDAPYFRTKYENTYFAAEFSAKSLAGFKLAAKRHVTKLLKEL